jgi:cytidylate kinase
MIITIDGPAGTGKTTVAKRTAERLNYSYFDTGAMYRAVAWWLAEKKTDLTDLDTVDALLRDFPFKIIENENEKKYFIGDIDVTAIIRTPEVTAAVSTVAALKPVREALWRIQRSFAQKGNAVFEGRDMGSAVFPHAEVKIFLTARPEVRAQRRLDEIVAKNPQEGDVLSHDKMLAAIVKRDHLDSTRALAPLKCPEGALQIDTSDLSIEQIVQKILDYRKLQTQ